MAVGLTPLHPAQRAAIDALVTSGRLAVVPPDLRRAQAFIRQANDALGRFLKVTLDSPPGDIAAGQPDERLG